MHKLLIAAGLGLCLSGCGAGRSYDYSPELASPLYGGRPCPGSATGIAGGPPTATDCVPGGREGNSGGRVR